MTFSTPTKTELVAILAKHRLTHKEMGEALGFSDAERTIRALVNGTRHGRPNVMSGVATAAMTYMFALHKIAAAHRNYQADQNPGTEARLSDALDEAVAILPKRLAPAGAATSDNSIERTRS